MRILRPEDSTIIMIDHAVGFVISSARTTSRTT
jgi:hypothetical protein